jgi:muconolactone D-isomerase
VEFLVRTKLTRPAGATDEDLARLMAAEKERAAELMAAGTLKKLWRVPGQWGAWAIWDAPDPTAFHAAITSLPLFGWMTVEVHPLAQHPFDAS